MKARKVLLNNSGIALVITMWLMVIMAVLAGQLAVRTRTDIGITINHKEDREAYFIAYAGIQMAINEILDESDFHYYYSEQQLRFAKIEDEENGQLFSSRRDVPIGAGKVSYEIQDLNSKLNLNRFSENRDQLILLLLTLFPEGEVDVESIADSIMDWVDIDDDQRANGAESDYYQSLTPSYGAKNGRFDAISELKQVRNVTQEVYTAISFVATIHPVEKLNVNTASETALRVSGLVEGEIAEILSARDAKGYHDTSARSRIFEITSTGGLGESQLRHSIKAVVRLLESRRLVIIDWADDYYASDES